MRMKGNVLVCMCGVILASGVVFAEKRVYQVVGIESEYGDVYFTDTNIHGDATGYVQFHQATEKWRNNACRAVFFDGQKGTLSMIGSLYPETKTRYVDAQPDRSSRGLAINDKRQIVGWSHVPGDDVRHAFIWTNGVMKDLGTLGGRESSAYALTENGEVAGMSTLADASEIYDRRHAFLYTGGTMKSLGALNGGKGNSEGRSIGYYKGNLAVGGWSTTHKDKRDTQEAVLWINGKIEKVSVPHHPDANMGSVNYIGPNNELAGGNYIVFGNESVKANLQKRGYFIDGNAQGAFVYQKRAFGAFQYDGLLFPGSRLALAKDIAVDSHGHYLHFRIRGIGDSGHLIGHKYKYDDQGRYVSLGIIAIPQDLAQNAGTRTPPSPRPTPTDPPPDDGSSDRGKLIFIAHGWGSDATVWAQDLRAILDREIAMRSDKDLWRVSSFDWSIEADTLFPLNAVENARKMGAEYGEIYATQNLEMVHLIGHSAGCHFVEEMSRKLNTSDTWVHTTFLDAYIPNGVHVKFGANADFAEHYFHGKKNPVSDEAFRNIYKGGTAGGVLSDCFNQDVADKMSSRLLRRASWIIGHGWPVKWYIDSAERNESYGLNLSPLFREKRATHDEFPRAR